jgi:hypothetical protein
MNPLTFLLQIQELQDGVHHCIFIIRTRNEIRRSFGFFERIAHRETKMSAFH